MHTRSARSRPEQVPAPRHRQLGAAEHRPGQFLGDVPCGSQLWSHHRARRFFSHTHWDCHDLGPALVRLVLAGELLLLAVDDTLFWQTGSKVHAIGWFHDGSVKGTRHHSKLYIAVDGRFESIADAEDDWAWHAFLRSMDGQWTTGDILAESGVTLSAVPASFEAVWRPDCLLLHSAASTQAPSPPVRIP